MLIQRKFRSLLQWRISCGCLPSHGSVWAEQKKLRRGAPGCENRWTASWTGRAWLLHRDRCTTKAQTISIADKIRDPSWASRQRPIHVDGSDLGHEKQRPGIFPSGPAYVFFAVSLTLIMIAIIRTCVFQSYLLNLKGIMKDIFAGNDFLIKRRVEEIFI